MTLPWKVRAKEREYVRRRRQTSGVSQKYRMQSDAIVNSADALTTVEPDCYKREFAGEVENDQYRLAQNPVGLTLSGGGIRSSTFCLGALQELSRAGLFPLFDYMSTVSGGGYIGACLSSLMTQAETQDRSLLDVGDIDGNDWKAEVVRPEGVPHDKTFPLSGNQPDQIHHLRKHGDFLIARQGLLRLDVLRTVGTAILSLACSLLLFLSMWVAFVCVYLLMVRLLGGSFLEVHSDYQLPQTGGKWWDALHLYTFWMTYRFYIFGGLAASLVSAFMWAFVKKPPVSHSRTTIEETLVDRRLVKNSAWSIAGLFFLAVFADKWITPDAGRSLTEPSFLYLPGLAGSAVFGIVALLTSLVLAVIQSHLNWARRVRSVAGSIIGIFVYWIIATTILVCAALLLSYLKSVDVSRFEATKWSGSIAALSGVASWLIARLHGKPPGGDAQKQTKRHLALDKLAWPLLIVFVASVFVLAGSVLTNSFNTTGWSVCLAASVVAVLILGNSIDYNKLSLHFFYRDRLAETFLMTEGFRDGCVELVRDDSDLRLSQLHDSFQWDSHCGKNVRRNNSAPYHIIQCAINLAGSDDLARKDVKSDVFTFSRLYTGSTTTGYLPTKDYANDEMTVAAALTVSGAAASSGMGFYTSTPLAVAATLFNVRLGLWLQNPLVHGSKAEFPIIEDRASATSSDKPKVNLKFRSLGRFWPLYLWREAAAQTTADLPYVNLSDGGHTGDNLGVYPMLQRRCRLIVVCDAEADPNFNFGSLANLTRMANVDENIPVEANIDWIRPNESGEHPKSHFLIGRVTYPRTEKTCDEEAAKNGGKLPADLYADHHGTHGWILYLKSSLTGEDEPVAVKSYAGQFPDFPHQSTTDQFFGDDQFEAYRLLGGHVAKTALKDFQSWAAEHNDFDKKAPIVNQKNPVDLLVRWCETRWKENRQEIDEKISREELAIALCDCKGKRATAKRLGIKTTQLNELMEQYGF